MVHGIVTSTYKRMIMKKDILSIKKYHIVVSRAATGIYLILKSLGIEGKKVLFPANICYAAIYPAVYAGNEPVFCDVDAGSGNLTLSLIEGMVNTTSEIVVLVLPHMYGNPVEEIKEIKDFCIRHGILLIEDCASAMGASIEGENVGRFGDYVIYSTGYAKTVDVGFGGIIASDHELDEMQKMYKQLPMQSKQSERNQEFFSKLYRLIRNEKKQTLAPFLYNGLYENVKDMYVYQIEPEKEKAIIDALFRLEDEIVIRRENYELYNRLIKENDCIKKYAFTEGAVPWRYNLLVLANRKELIAYSLEKGLPISDWYPDVTEIFGVTEIFPNTKSMEEKIINFPLNIDREKIQMICSTVNAFFER